MKRDKFLHILRLLHFTDNRIEPDTRDENSDWLWKVRNVFDILKQKFSKSYNPSHHLAIDEVIDKYKGRVIFWQYIPKKHKHFGIKIYKLSNETGYTCDTTVYLDRDRQRRVQNLTAAHSTVSERVNRRSSRISVSIIHPLAICSISSENISNPCLEWTSCILSRKTFYLCFVASSGICVWSKSACAVLLWDSVSIVSTIVSSSYITNFHSCTFVFEKISYPSYK